MKLIIFAGGIGTRLWPLSRRQAPKQFEKMFNNKSTLELAIERVAPVFGMNNIFVQTSPSFKKIVKKIIPKLPAKNLIIEPARRNLAAAICYSLIELKKQRIKGALALLWADHLMKNKNEFIKALKAGENLIKQEPQRFIFLAEKPRFANNNLGWIHVGKKLGHIGPTNFFEFLGWKYKPEQSECDKMFKSKEYYWNPGYFITSVDFLLANYIKKAPKIFQAVNSGEYVQAPAKSFDHSIVEKIGRQHAVVIKTKMGWSDPGTLYALKEALAKNQAQNISQGQVYNLDSQDCLVYNLEKNKLVATLGLQSMVVVNTPDATIVVPKHKVKDITRLLKKLDNKGLSKYL